MTLRELPKAYAPKDVEARWYGHWEQQGYFHADAAKVSPDHPPFVIVMPPPNITGSLHMGHALDNAIPDVLIRWKRMQGFEACWVPGTDHAGIATQNVVEKELRKEGKSRHDLGREKFLERVWAWKEQYGRTIVEQLKRLGASCDWNREAFTMDAAPARAVREAFLRLYHEGLIYRGLRMVNWCPRCLTAISDLEVEHEERDGTFWHVRYPFADGSPGGVVIATTRPETILADVALAVHPEDDRYRALLDRKAEVLVPLSGPGGPETWRAVPIVGDEAVDREFGTGALKITPAHDAVDFEVGRRHNLSTLSVIDEHGRMTPEAGRFAGLDRFECRKAFVTDLAASGCMVKEEPYHHAVAVCSRCDQVIEPRPSVQWFMKMESLAKPAIDAAKDGRITFIPERFGRLYVEWMENIRDWCISRQLWWGHRIPVWRCAQCADPEAHIVPQPGEGDPAACPACGGRDLVQDPDVLDTWFSSGLWPMSVFGWPEQTPDLKAFYPTDVIITARDILYLWEARMIMFGLKFMGKAPFSRVHIHATILNKEGRRMSKSLGTGVDPLELFDTYGTDATRFGLLYMTSQGQDIRFSQERMEMSRNFANKIWNACRFALGVLPAEIAEQWAWPSGRWFTEPLADPERWILDRLNRVVALADKSLVKYDFGTYARALYDFFWDDFCDWYIELAKPHLGETAAYGDRERVQQALYKVLDTFLRLAHPLMPFLTEDLWHALWSDKGDCAIAAWPQEDPALQFGDDVETMQQLINVVREIRKLRSDLNVPPRETIAIHIQADDMKMHSKLIDQEAWIQRLANCHAITYGGNGVPAPEKAVTARVAESGVEVYIALSGDALARESARLGEEGARLQRELESVRRKLGNEGFVAKASRAIVEKEQTRAADLADRLSKVNGRLTQLAR